MTVLLGIETSCDETAVAVVRDGVHVLAQRVASQVDLHARFGGVIPELASRSHLEVLFPLLDETLAAAEMTLADVDALAVTTRPGLIGCLLVGLGATKGLSLATGLPLVPVDHVQAHIYGALMEGATRPEDAPWPLASLVVSGGHTSLYESRAPTEQTEIGRTLDDAAGEAYDKVGALLGLPYPGGPAIDRLASSGNGHAFAFPRSRPGSLDFSFSGLKTAVLYAARGANTARGAPLRADVSVADLAASFQTAVVDVLVARLLDAADAIGAGGLLVCGGVAANSALRAAAGAAAQARGLPLFIPSRALATDNAVMVAGLGHHLFARGLVAALDVDAVPR